VARGQLQASTVNRELALRVLRLGLGEQLAADLCGVTLPTFRAWRTRDPVFDIECRQAEAHPIVKAAEVLDFHVDKCKDLKAAQYRLDRLSKDYAPPSKRVADTADDEKTLAEVHAEVLQGMADNLGLGRKPPTTDARPSQPDPDLDHSVSDIEVTIE